jgi:hypothetical protein
MQDCTQTKHLAAGTSNAVRLSRFFDKVNDNYIVVQPCKVLLLKKWMEGMFLKKFSCVIFDSLIVKLTLLLLVDWYA